MGRAKQIVELLWNRCTFSSLSTNFTLLEIFYFLTLLWKKYYCVYVACFTLSFLGFHKLCTHLLNVKFFISIVLHNMNENVQSWNFVLWKSERKYDWSGHLGRISLFDFEKSVSIINITISNNFYQINVSRDTNLKNVIIVLYLHWTFLFICMQFPWK